MNQLTGEIGMKSATENLSDVQWKYYRSSHALQYFSKSWLCLVGCFCFVILFSK